MAALRAQRLGLPFAASCPSPAHPHTLALLPAPLLRPAPLPADETKFAWKIQRDMAERGHSLESIKASIEARKPDFDAYIDPQKKKADMIIQVRGGARSESCCAAGHDR